MNAELSVADLRFAYTRGAEELFDGLTHRFTPGAVTALTGPSGRGKSTLLYVLGRLTPAGWVRGLPGIEVLTHWREGGVTMPVLILTARGLERIVEYKDADAAVRDIALCNSGVMALDASLLRQLIVRLTNQNASGEYYLTDLVALARAEGCSTDVVTCDEAETLGINTRAELAQAEASFQARKRAEALENGVTLSDAATVWFALDTVIGRDAVIGPNVVFGPGVTVESGAEILPFCHLEGCHISAGATVGPFARLRPGAELGADVHVGNFVEIKNAVLDEGVKVGHLTYLGDAHVGERTNIGAGTITCNYDGVMKHRTEIGARAFIGSDTMLVAPVRVGDDAMTGSGSVITADVPDGALAIGRARQDTKPGLATRLMAALRAKKEAR